MRYFAILAVALGCNPAKSPAPCLHPDLDAEYQRQMDLACPDLSAAECPDSQLIGWDYERKVYERCSSNP